MYNWEAKGKQDFPEERNSPVELPSQGEISSPGELRPQGELHQPGELHQDLLESSGKRFSPKSSRKKILIFIALVAITAIALRPLQLSLQDRLGKARDLFISRLEELLGYKIQYGSIGPSIFKTIDISDIVILREDSSVLLSVSRLRFAYSLLNIIQGNIQTAFKSAIIDRPVLSLDFERDSELIKRFGSSGEGNSSFRISEEELRGLLPVNFSVRLLNGEWETINTAGNLKFSGLNLDASIRQNLIDFQGAWDAQVFLSPNSGVFGQAGLGAVMKAQVSGEYSGDTGSGSALLQIPSLEGDFFVIKPIAFNILFSGSSIELRKTYDRVPVAFSLEYDFSSRKLRSFFEGENFSPTDLVEFTGSWEARNSALAFNLGGALSIEKEDTSGLVFSVDFSGSSFNSSPENSILNRATLGLKAQGNRDMIRIDTVNIRSPNGAMEFQGGVDFYSQDMDQAVPYGALSLSNFRLRGNRGISGDFLIGGSGREIGITSDNLKTETAALSALELSLIRESYGLVFAFSVSSPGESEEPLKEAENSVSGSISLSGSLDYEPRQIQANLGLDAFSLENILSFVEPFAEVPVPPILRPFASDVAITTELFFFTDYRRVLYSAPNAAVSYNGILDILAEASFSGTDRGIELNACTVSWGKETMEVNGSVNFSGDNNVSFFLETGIRDLTYFFDGMIHEKRSINIRGSYGFQVFLTEGLNGAYSGFWRGENIPIPSGDRFASLSFLFSLQSNSASSWRAAVERFQITGLTTPASSAASLSFSGRANERGLEIGRMVFDDGRGALEARINAEWDAEFRNISFMSDVTGSSNGENYNLSGTYIDKRLEFLFSGRRMQLYHFIQRNAVADGSFKLNWESPSSFEVEAFVPSFVLYQQSGVIRASVDAVLNNDSFLAQNLKLNYSGVEADIPFIRIDRTTSRAETEARIWGIFSERPVEILANGAARFGSSQTWFDLLKDFGSIEGALNVSSAVYDTIQAEEPFAFNFNVNRENTGYSINLNGGPRNMLRFSYRVEESGGGNFYAALSAPSPVRGTFAGFFSIAAIDAQGTDLYVDMGSLWRFIPPTSPIVFPAGIVTLSVRVAGSFEDPEFFGSARASSVQMMVPEFIPEPIRPPPFQITFSGDEISFGPVDAIVGQGRGRVQAGFRFDQWIPSIFSIGITVSEESPIPYDFDISGVMAKGLAYGNLGLDMDDFVLLVSGNLTAQETEISLDYYEILASEGRMNQNSENKFVSVMTDISIRTGRRVDFFWPRADFPIFQANADLGTGVHITSDSVAQRFTFTGDVRLRSGEIFYLERNFYIREGELFFRENESQFDPRVTVRAEIRDQADSGPVTISMIIDNAPLRSFTPRFVSSPPLSQMEIYSILGQNAQTEGEQRNLATSVVIDSLAQFTVIGRLQRQVRNFLGLDMLSVRTQLIQNVLLRATGSQPNRNSVTGGGYRAGNYFDNTTIFLGKFFGAELFGEAMLSFRYDENKIDMGGLVIEPELGLEMKNPLFDIRLNMLPLHPENMFIDDVSFSFIWRRSF